MKLYTEKQMKKCFDDAQLQWHNNYHFQHENFEDYKKVCNSIPIELPSDEEILMFALENTNNINEQILFNNGAVYVCKLIEEQIKKQQNK